MTSGRAACFVYATLRLPKWLVPNAFLLLLPHNGMIWNDNGMIWNDNGMIWNDNGMIWNDNGMIWNDNGMIWNDNGMICTYDN